MSRRFSAATTLAAGVILVVPFGEGGRTPLALVAGQLLVLGFAFAVYLETRGTVGDRALRPVLGVLAALLGLACLSAVAAADRYAALLGTMDRVTAAAGFAGALFHFGSGEGLRRLRVLLVASSSMQAACALGLAATGGLQEAARLFQNRSHLGAYVALGTALATGALLEPSSAHRLRRSRHHDLETAVEPAGRRR